MNGIVLSGFFLAVMDAMSLWFRDGSHPPWRNTRSSGFHGRGAMPKMKVLSDRCHIVVVVVNAVSELDGLAGTHCRLGQHLILRHGVWMTRQMGMDINDHGGLPQGGS